MGEPIDFKSLRSSISELSVDGNSEYGTEAAEKLKNDFKDELEKKFNWISSEWPSNLSTLPSEDEDEILGQLTKETGQVESENVAVGQKIEELQRRCVEDFDEVESEIEKMWCLLEFIEAQSEDRSMENMQIDVSRNANDQTDFSYEHDSKFKMLELSHQIEKTRTTLKPLQDLESIYKRFDAVEKIEDSLTGLKVIDIEGNSIRLSLKTCIPYLEPILHQQEIEEPLEMNHELMIETLDGTWELKNVEIFPNDVYIGEVVDATKALRQFYLTFPVIENRSSLESFVRRVQERITLTTLRRFFVKNANKSRHSFEYLDREDMIIAHVAGGIDAFIKLPQGWPISDLALELISLKSTSQYSKEISLSFLCKIVGMANSLNTVIRQSISTFANSIEEMLMQQMREQLHPDKSITSN